MSLREAMPTTAAFIDAMREAFGAKEINAAIKGGMAGQPNHFHAVENGQTAGTPFETVEGYPASVVKPNRKTSNAR